MGGNGETIKKDCAQNLLDAVPIYKEDGARESPIRLFARYSKQRREVPDPE